MRGLKVAELGAGTGLAGCVCGLLGAATVVFTELPEALPLLERNAKRVLGSDSGSESGDNGNPAGEGSPWQRVTTPVWSGDSGAQSHERGALFAVEALAWGDGHPLGPACAAAAPFDLILVADCVYLPELYSALVHTVKQLAGPGAEVLICFEQRRRDISAFFDLLGGGGEDDNDGESNDGARRPASRGDPHEAGAAGSEHLPGSDGRRPPSAPRRVVAGPALEEAALRATAPGHLLSSKLGWEQSPLLTQARDLAKVHLARVVLG